MAGFGYFLAHFNVLAICLVLLGAFGVQFGLGELPCPLCALQRMAMLLCALGPAYVILRARRGVIAPSDFASGYGLSVLAAVAGATISGRQILLHVLPGDPGFGDAVLGLHLYSWAFVVFVTVLVMSGLNLIFNAALCPGEARFGKASAAVVGLLALIMLANAGSMFVQEGLHWTLPDDPEQYQLLHDFLARTPPA